MTTSSPEPVGVLVIDKPEGMTSHDVVARMRRVLRTRKVGHAGTLDPMATGVLVLACGRGTRLLPYLQATRKEYTGTVRLGFATSTDDRTGDVVGDVAAVAADAAAVDAVLAGFHGPIDQVPSAFSAVKIDGRRAYALARAGQQVDLEPRPVEIYDLHRTSPLRPTPDAGAEFDIDVVCSTGTYIRALARDIGRALGCGAHLTALRRTAVGPFVAAHATVLPQLGEAPEVLQLGHAVSAVLPHVVLPHDAAQRVSHGLRIEAAGDAPCGPVALLWPNGDLLAVAESHDGRWHYRVVFPET